MNYNSDNITLTFNLKNEKIYMKGNAKYDLMYIAPKPMEKRLSYSGSGLPFSNEDMALYNTKTQGKISKGDFKLVFDYPNTHYEFCSANLLKPYIKFTNLQNNSIDHVVLGNPLINNRSLIELNNNQNHPRTTYGGFGGGGL
jgi:hypothetical protein